MGGVLEERDHRCLPAAAARSNRQTDEDPVDDDWAKRSREAWSTIMYQVRAGRGTIMQALLCCSWQFSEQGGVYTFHREAATLIRLRGRIRCYYSVCFLCVGRLHYLALHGSFLICVHSNTKREALPAYFGLTPPSMLLSPPPPNSASVPSC